MFEDFEYTDELESGDTMALIFRARVGDKSVQGIDYLRHRDDGLIQEFTVMLRPLSAIMAVGERMAPQVEGLAKAAQPPSETQRFTSVHTIVSGRSRDRARAAGTLAGMQRTRREVIGVAAGGVAAVALGSAFWDDLFGSASSAQLRPGPGYGPRRPPDDARAAAP